MTETHVHDAIARALRDLNVQTMFGLMGDANLFMVDKFVRTYGGRYIAATHEATSVMMACGHAAMTGEIGVATITQGPALSNAVTALIEGAKGSLPVVLLCGDTPAAAPEHQQALAQRALVEATGAGFEQMRTAETVVADVAAAFRRARAERRPIVLNMPAELMWEMTSYAAPAGPPEISAASPAMGPALENAIGVIAAARRPVVLAGRGAIDARDALIRLAGRIGAPLATTLKAKGLFRGEPFDLGVFGTLSTPAASEIIASADCVLAFGAGLNQFTTVKGGLLEGKRLIQIDDDPRQLGRRATPDAALQGDPALTANALVHWLDEADIASSQATDTLQPGALTAPQPLQKPTNRAGTIDLSLALTRLDQALPPDRVYVTDGGRFLNEAWTRINVTGPENMLLSINTGAIGMGFGHAVGAAVARPDQLTLLITGDGGFMMSGMAEFVTAVRENLRLMVVVCNDGAYGAEYVQFEDRQMDPTLSLFNWPPLAGVADALGGRGVQVRSEAELEEALSQAADTEGPILVELMLDPATVPRLHL